MHAPMPVTYRLVMPAIWLGALVSAVAWGIVAPVESWTIVGGLAVAGIVIDMFSVEMRRGMRVSTAHFVAPFAIITDSVTGGLIAGACCLLGRRFFDGGWKWTDVAINIVSASVAGLFWHNLWREDAYQIEVAPAVFVCAFIVLLFTLLRSLLCEAWAEVDRRRGLPTPDARRSITVLMTACTLALTPALAYNVTEEGENMIWTIVLIPVLAMQFLLRAFRREREAVEREQGLNQSLERANVSLTESLVTALDARDPYTAGHSIAVAIYARDIAAEMGLGEPDIARIYLAGLLHDVGKIAVPDHILAKVGRLTSQEFAAIKEHPVVGEAILRPAAHFRSILAGVRHHHERIDGRGYPDGLGGSDVPLDARILAVADAYNAMTSDRPYREGMDPEVARQILIRHRGQQHDERVVDALLQVLDARDADYSHAAGPEFERADVVRLHRELPEQARWLAASSGLDQPERDDPGSWARIEPAA